MHNINLLKYLGFIFLSGFFCIPLIGQDLQWKEFTSYEGRFKVNAPGAFQEKIDTVETDIGKLAYHTFFWQTDDKKADNLVYMISYCDYPVASVHSDSTSLLEDFFTATMDAAAFSVDGKLLYSDDIQLVDYPGKLWRIDYLKGDAIIKTKAFVVENRYYSIQAIMLKNKSLNTSTDKFMDSFGLFSP